MAVIPTLVVALLPKCPLCVAAYLTAVGLSAELAPAVRPVAYTLLGIAVAVALARRMADRRSA